MLVRRIAGYESAHSRRLFRHFLNTPAEVEITDNRVEVTLPKRAHNPLLLAAGFGQSSTPIPWWDRRPLALTQVRHGAGWNCANWLRISSGCGRVYTTFAVEFEAVGKADAELLKERLLLGRGFGDAAQTDLMTVRSG
jgi:hypothetical protein